MQGTGKEKREPLRPRRLGAGAGAGAGEGRGARLPGREPPSLPSRPLSLSPRGAPDLWAGHRAVRTACGGAGPDRTLPQPTAARGRPPGAEQPAPLLPPAGS